PVFVNLKTCSTFVPWSIVPKSNELSSKVITGNLPDSASRASAVATFSSLTLSAALSLQEENAKTDSTATIIIDFFMIFNIFYVFSRPKIGIFLLLLKPTANFIQFPFFGKFLHNFVQDSVDEDAAFGGRIFFGNLQIFVDGGANGN